MAIQPIHKKDLHGTVVMARSVMDLQLLGEKTEENNRISAGLIDAQFAVLKAFGDLYLELTDKTAERRFIERRIRQAEHEVARTRLPLWFLRPEAELTLEEMVERRARFLLYDHLKSWPKDARMDDTWDLLREFITDWAKAELSDTDLERIIEKVMEQSDASA